MEHVASETLGVYAHQGRRANRQIAHREHHRFFAAPILAPFEAVYPENAELRWKVSFRYFSQK
jgi:hypothetical protein